MLNNCELKILGLLLRKPEEFYSINDLAKKINLAYPYVYDSVKNLEKKELLKVKRIGKSNLCQVQFKCLEYLAIAALEMREEFLAHNLSIGNLTHQLHDALTDELYILLLFGRYAQRTASKTSDIDLFFIIQDQHNIESFRKKVKAVLNKLDYPVEFEISTMSWFYAMLGDKNTVGREIFKANIILHNAESYLHLVQKYDQRQRH